MNAEWNDQTLDDILSDMQRMTRERGAAEAEADAPLRTWTMGEVDALLDEDNALIGLGEYELEPEFPYSAAQRSEAEEPKEPEPPAYETVEPQQEEAQAQEAEPEAEKPPQSAKAAPFSRLFSQFRRKDLHAQSAPEEPEEAAEPALQEVAFKPDAPEEPDDAQVADNANGSAESEVTDTPEEPDAPETEEKNRVIEKTIVASKKPKAQPKAKEKKTDPEMVDGQMMLLGFDAEDEVEQVDEVQAEKELNERRKTQVKKFQLYDFAEKYEPDLPPKKDVFEPEPEPSAESDDADENEYVRFSDRMRIGRILQEERRSSFLSVCVLGITTVVMIVLSALTGAATADGKSILYAIILVLLSLSVAVSFSTFRKGFFDLIRWKPSCDSAALVTMLGVLIQGVASFVLPASGQSSGVFCAAAVFLLLLCRIAKLFEAIGTVSNFKFCAFTASEHLHAIRAFERESDAFEIGKVLPNKQPKLRYSQKTRFPALFRKYADFRSLTDRICSFLLPVGVGAAVLMAVAGWFKTESVADALSAFAGALCVALPAGAAFTVSVPLVLLMQNLNRHGGMIASPEAARENAGVHGVAVDAVDLYDAKHTDVYCFQDYGTLHFDAMYLYAAALAIGAHSPAESAFLHAVGNPEILPPVQGLIYEERLGISATINRKNVLLGNRNLLTNHSIDPPPKSGEVPYIQQNKRVLYLAVDGKVAGMFVIDYVQKKALSVPLRILQDNDTNLLVYAPDCNVTEDFISANFRLRKGGVRLLDSTAGDLLRKRQAEETEHMPATAMHNGSTESLMRTLADAAVMQNIQRVAAFIGLIGCAIGWLVSFILLLVKGVGAMNWIFATVYPAVWMALSSAYGIWQARKAMK